MALQTSGAISLANVQTEFGGVNPISISEYYGKAAGIPASGAISLSHFYGKSNAVLTLKEVVFNASGTFTMPSGVVNNQIIVGCTGGGGGGYYYYYETQVSCGGGGSGRVVSTLTMAPGATASVVVGAGGSAGYAGGTSAFTGATSCGGGGGGVNYKGRGVSGGGTAEEIGNTTCSCAAALALTSGAVDRTTGLWLAKNVTSANYSFYAGGAGCYGGGSWNEPGGANTGAGGGCHHSVAPGAAGGSGKVVVWYYVYE